MKSFKTKQGTELPVMNMRGKDYLEVKYRLVWFREERPNWSIETSFVSVTENETLAKAVIKDEQGRILATGHKREDKKGFADHTEKAETGAIGRALALLGYGTQFCADELDEGDRIVDAPIQRDSGLPKIKPEQPDEGDGVQDESFSGYRIPFGKFAQRSLEEIDRKQLENYIQYLESSAKKKNQPITGQVADFIKRAENYLAALDNASLEPNGASWLQGGR